MRKAQLFIFFILCTYIDIFISFNIKAEGNNGSIVPPSNGMSEKLFTNTLGEIEDALRIGITNAVYDSITYDFLHSVTNVTYQKILLPYTRKWIDTYGDTFPEVFLLHSLAGGKTSCLSSKYNSLTNLVSKNCIRWVLMVNNEPLTEDLISAKQGKYFKIDQKLWSHEPAEIIHNVIFSKMVTFSKKGRRKLWTLVLRGNSVVVRNDKVPVPWGRDIYPDIHYYPDILPNKWLLKSYNRLHDKPSQSHCTQFWSRSHCNVTRQPLGFRSYKSNRTWNFFIQVYSPFEFLDGQAITSKATAPCEISGRFHYLSRVLVQRPDLYREECTIDFFNDKGIDQDIVLAPPINFSITKEGSNSSIKFSWEGAIFDANDVKTSDFPPKRSGIYNQICLHRFIFKWLGILSILSFGILLWEKFHKKSGVKRKEMDNFEPPEA